jgi:hypothetical protein
MAPTTFKDWMGIATERSKDAEELANIRSNLEIIRSNLETAGLQDVDIRIQPDLLSGWRIAVISDEFTDMSMADRRGTALKGLEEIDIGWDEFLTHQEMEWVGDPFADTGVETLPLWPEALERGQCDSGEMHFPSELDEDLELPICASFYSLRGGVGRSTALACTGRILSAKGRKVVCVDMDLEAPGLASLFGCEQQVEANQGVADLLVQIDQGETPDITGHLIKVSDDDLYCLPAGIASANYARLLRFIDPVAWYREEKNPLRSLIEMIETSEALLKMDQLGLRLNDWLSVFDEGLKQKTTILFDGLDVGFGSSEPDRKRRNTAISGLFDFWMNRESKLSNVEFKIFLREDLWKSIIFENKSHLYGRSVTLKWTERVTYYRVAIKQAIRSETFKTALKALGDEAKALDPRFENWSDAEVQKAWNLLVGERMKGGKTAFTRNWVWSRLADGKDDHSPRYLLQLFNRIVEWEKKEHQRSPYERSIIRPRAMEKCLPDVSQEALDALSEEFREELAGTINHIKSQTECTIAGGTAF